VRPPRPRRKVSWWRLALTLGILAGTVALGVAVEHQAVADSGRKTTGGAYWFAPYVDTTLAPLLQFQDPTASPPRSVVLGFVVADPHSACSPSWGGVYSLSAASDALDLDRRIARFRQQGGSATVSFGGQANTELAVSCNDTTRLAAAYRSVVTRYHLASIDLDIEGGALNDSASFARRAAAIRQVQAALAKSGKKLSVWLTLPVAPAGMPISAVQVVRAMLTARVAVAGVNVMTMDFGGSRPPSQSMIAAVEESLTAASRQLAAVYRAAGKNLGSRVWSLIGVTPMVGQNDTASDQFTVESAQKLVAFVRNHGISRISMWSLNRDQPCGPNVVSQTTVMNSCSGIGQQPFAFSRLFAAGAEKPAKIHVVSPSLDRVVADNPATSPYPIWRSSYGYARGYKVVWHGYVFQAKWWSQGVAPDTPVTHEWQTPWQVIGPVMPGEHPPVLRRLPAGTYPAWSGTATYQKGQRVLLDGLPYEAKWFTRGDPPQEQAANVWDSPWLPLFTIPGEPVAPTGTPPPQPASPAANSG
jgi:chitinase